MKLINVNNANLRYFLSNGRCQIERSSKAGILQRIKRKRHVVQHPI